MEGTAMTRAPAFTVPADVLSWLSSWEQQVQAQHFDDATELFSPHVHSFGTVMPVVSGRDALVLRQWRAVWPRTRGFRFIPESIRGWGDDDHYCVAAQWLSEGLDAQHQIYFERQGRATLVLQKTDVGRQAVHSHLSINPLAEAFLPPVQ